MQENWGVAYSDPVENSEKGEALTVSVYWGEDLIHLTHLQPPRSFTIGSGADVDFALPEALVAAKRVEFVQVDSAGLRVGLEAERELRKGEDYQLQLGELRLVAQLADAEVAPPRSMTSIWDPASAWSFALSTSLFSSLYLALAFYQPQLATLDELGSSKQRLLLLQQILESSAERDRDRELLPKALRADEEQHVAAKSLGELVARKRRETQTEVRSSGLSASLKGEQGGEGSPAGASSSPADFGMLALLRADTQTQIAAFGAGSLMTEGLADGLFGDGLGDGPLELQGSGSLLGPAVGVAINSIGDGCCGRDAGGSLGEGPIGTRIGGTHQRRAPKIELQKATTSGTLPPGVVQRIVRQNFGRFRLCYDEGLRLNPSLAGRVSVRFVIDRGGSVSTAQLAGSDLGQAQVEGCVLKAFYALSFPAPEHGVVRVTYPLVFWGVE